MIPAIVLLVTYSIALIAAGHGVGPVGYLLVMGRAEEWIPGQWAGWVSIVALILVSVFFRAHPRTRALAQLIAASGLYLSWFLFAQAASDGRAYGIANLAIFAAPFQVASLIVSVLLLRQALRPGSAAR